MIINKYEEEQRRGYVLKKKVKKVFSSFFSRREEKIIEEINRKYEICFNDSFKDYDNDLFYAIQIETINRCNGICPFCPVNRNMDTRKLVKMTEELYKKIIDELAELNYCGKISISSNNEPLMDKNLVERVRYAREKLPRAYMYIYTNGTLMKLEDCRKLARYLNRIYIDNYNDELVLADNIKIIAKECERDSELNEKVYICLRKIHEVLWTRGGQAPNNNKKIIRDYPCFLPFCQMIIRPDGKVSLCCSDALGKYTLGDVSEQSLINIWEGEAFNAIRKKIRGGDIATIDLCKYCDAKHKD